MGLVSDKPLLERARKEGIALTFDDVRLKTGYSETMPEGVSLETKFSKNVGLKIPIVSAAMDTVTEAPLAIEVAKLGGLGIIHRGMSIGAQKNEVDRVKHCLSGLIEKPIPVFENERVSEVLAKGYHFTSFPVLNVEGQLVGIVTGNDFDFCDDDSSYIRDIMSENLWVSSPDTDIDTAYERMKKEKKKILPLIDDHQRVTGMYVFSDLKRIKTGSAENYNVDDKGRLRVGAAVGIGKEALERTGELVRKGVDVVVIDSAHADSKNVIDILEKIKQEYNSLDVVVGNISNGDSITRLIDAGADGIKVGQGPGSICTTRIVAGIGSPQVSAIYDCARIAEKYGIPLCADGGLKHPGDVTIAIGAGADSVMMGSMLAGTKEAPGDIIFLEGRQWKDYRGMGSEGAVKDTASLKDRYQSSGETFVPEGVEGRVPYKGYLEDVLTQYVGGLKKGMGYVGANSIQELREKARFCRITGPGLSESHPHDIRITKDVPTYIGDGL